MFKGHPKGLYVLGISNMGERFGYYTMLAIFTLFLREYYGWSTATAQLVYGSGFLMLVYFMPLFGGLIADKLLGYGRTITIGIFVMIAGYALLAFSRFSPVIIFAALFIISAGNGMFKGNLAVIVGNLYNKSSGSLKDAAFNLYYMGINVGAFFAPYAAAALKNYFLGSKGFVYNADMALRSNEFLHGASKDIPTLANFFHINPQNISLLQDTAHNYINTLGMGYNAGFALSAVAMIVSLLVFLGFKKYYKYADYTSKDKAAATQDVVLTKKQEKDRIFALFTVFFIVIIFWMAFHQNGASMTFFAQNYTNLNLNKITYLFFNLPSLLSIIAVILGVILLIIKNLKSAVKVVGGVLFVGGIAGVYYFWNNIGTDLSATPELFQSFNPLFIVFLSPVVVGFFSWLNNINKEPSSPAKIGLGMLLTAVGFSILMIGSYGLPSVNSLGGHTSPTLVTPYWLISTYFTLTIAELFLSPMGLSFVSKVAPPRMKGLMQGGWLAATAVGNLFAGLIGDLYQNWELWQFFAFLVGMSLLSAIAVALVLKKLKAAISS